MVKRPAIALTDIADQGNLARAVWRAAIGKRHRLEVRRFVDNLDRELEALGQEILDLSVPLGRCHCFSIRDPKPRAIHAPVFRERVLHHAVMAHVGPVLDRALVADTFACRPGKGNWAAVQRAWQHSRRFTWYLKLDMRSFFASVDHEVLKMMLRRRIKGPGILALCDRIIDAFHGTTPGRGLPIGALTSQHFANFYLR